MKKDFWHNSTVVVVGGGSWGTVLAHLAARNCSQVHLWTREEEHAREINSTRTNLKYSPDQKLSEKIRAYSSFERAFEHPVQAVIWALPSGVTRDRARELAPFLAGDEIILHATKGVEPGTLKRISVILSEELPCRRIGVISGPNLATEIARGEPAATVVASGFPEVIEAGQELLRTEYFRVYGVDDVVGVEWAGTLKNILAIASGMIEGLGLGWNSRATLISRGLAEMVRFGVAMGGVQSTFLGLAGVGDLLATCSSPLSRNFQVGFNLAKGKKLAEILSSLGRTAEGVRTTQSVWDFAQERGIYMPITEQVYRLLSGERQVKEALYELMGRPQLPEFN